RCRRRAARAACDVARSCRLRREGEGARADVSVELREVRAGRAARGRGFRPPRLAEDGPRMEYGAGGVIFDGHGRVLLVRESHPEWEPEQEPYVLPGGKVGPGEAPGG